MEILKWAEEHPWTAGALTLGAVFILLWLLGFFGGSSSSQSSSSGTNLAAAYYAAEAAQTTAGTQLQMATQYYAAQTAQDQIQANAATGIASTQANMYTTLGQQNASSSTAIAQTQADYYTAAANDQLLATENSNNDAAATAATEAQLSYNSTIAGINGGILNNYISNVLPGALAYGGGFNQAYLGAGIGDVSFAPTSTYASPTQLAAQGYSPSGVAGVLGVPLSSIG